MTRWEPRRIASFAVASVMLVAGALGARAQGLYYKEIKKDERIYVFNDAKRAAAFEASGEVGTGLTRIGVGPNGETVVGDSEKALQLFFFKYGIAEVVEEPKAPVQKVEWRDGKTRFTLGSNFYMELSNRVQVRFTQELPDETVTLAGTAQAGDGKGSFRIRRAKTKFEGWFYKNWLQYEVQLNWPDLNSTNASRALEDANINWDLSRGKKAVMVKFGQYKVPFGRQELTSSGSQMFIDRSDVSNRYARGRETGLQLWGLTAGNKLEWRVGAFNGNGRSNTTNDNDKFQYNARFQFQPNGDPRYSEIDFDSRDKALWALAVNFEHNDKTRATTSTDTKDLIWGVDFVFKRSGLFLTGEYYDKDADPETGSDFKDKGWFGQAGYLFGGPSKGQWNLGLRYGQFDPTDLRDNDKRKEIGGVLGYYYNKHNLKVEADFRQIEDEAANSGRGTKNKEFRLQTQLIF
jgi:phosphate-selective porin OprO/OprP